MTWLFLSLTVEPRQSYASEKQSFHPASSCLHDASPMQRTEQIQHLHTGVILRGESLDLVQTTGKGPLDIQEHGRTSLKAVRE